MMLHQCFAFGTWSSLVTNVVLNSMDASIKCNGILLDDNLLLDQGVNLLLEEVGLIHIIDLKLLEVFFQVGDILNDLLQNVIGSLSGVVLKSRALRPQELHFFLVLVEKFDCIFCSSLLQQAMIKISADHELSLLTSSALTLFLMGRRLAA